MDSGNSVMVFHLLEGPILFAIKQVYSFKLSNPFYTGDSLMITLTNSGDPDEMLNQGFELWLGHMSSFQICLELGQLMR